MYTIESGKVEDNSKWKIPISKNEKETARGLDVEASAQMCILDIIASAYEQQT